MLRWLGNTLASSIGKKALMALTGLLLVGFLFTHLAGNALLYVGDERFDQYVEDLKSWGPLLYVAEALLAILFACHIYLGVRVSMENREARAQGYVVRGSKGKSTVASMSMLVTGVIVLGFLIKHLIDFRFDDSFAEAPAERVKSTLATPVHALLYVGGVTALMFHLAHAFRSACQSLGVSHPKLTPLFERTSLALALVLGAGFLSFPIIYWLG